MLSLQTLRQVRSMPYLVRLEGFTLKNVLLYFAYVVKSAIFLIVYPTSEVGKLLIVCIEQSSFFDC